MQPYATITGTRRNIAEMRKHGWALLLTPDTTIRGGMKPPGDFRYALDNGAWGCHQRGLPFDDVAFGELVQRWGERAEWVVLPDIVAGGLCSLAFSLSWMSRIDGLRLLAVQDGMTPDDVRPHLGAGVGLFLGGSTEWKLATIYMWGELASEVGCYYHVARVNTRRRIKKCALAGADSFDGTSATRFSVNAGWLADAARSEASQVCLFRRDR